MKSIFLTLFKTLIIFLIASGLHFLYDLTGGFYGVAWFCPVNESVWEHLKLCYYPFLIFGLIYRWWLDKRQEKWGMKNSGSLYDRKSEQLNRKIFLINLMKASLCSIIIVLSGHYIGMGGFMLSGSWWDIPVFALSIFAGVLICDRKVKNPSGSILFVLLYHVIVILGFAYFTWYPADFPIFKDFSK